jgi:SAM-dependent methyltransferase
MSNLGRETPSCLGCGSTPRYRAFISILSRELFGSSIPLPEFPLRKDIRGVGLSDWDGYAAGLAAHLDYENTYFHKEPRLDITSVPAAMEGQYDFVISTEVFEHISPPISRAFTNTLRLLKPGGLLVLTVPYVSGAGVRTVEHFPRLNDYDIVERDGKPVLRNTTVAGEVEEFQNLIFHGGEGAALELRVFSEESLMAELRDAAFAGIEIISGSDFKHGFYWEEPWSRPVIARRPA